MTDLLAADEAFITSTLKEVMPDRAPSTARPIGSGRPGPVTLRLLEAYRDVRRAALTRPAISRGGSRAPAASRG